MDQGLRVLAIRISYFFYITSLLLELCCMLDLNFFNIKKNSLTLSLNLVQRLKFENSQLDSFPSPGMKLNYMGVTLMCDLVDMAGPKIKKKKQNKDQTCRFKRQPWRLRLSGLTFLKNQSWYIFIYILSWWYIWSIPVNSS